MSKDLTITKFPGPLLTKLLVRPDFGSLLAECSTLDRAVARQLDASSLAHRASFLLLRGLDQLGKRGTIKFDDQELQRLLGAGVTPAPLQRLQIRSLPVEVLEFLRLSQRELADELAWLDSWSLDTLASSPAGSRAVFLIYAGLASILAKQNPQACSAPASTTAVKTSATPTAQPVTPAPAPAPQNIEPQAAQPQKFEPHVAVFTSAISPNDSTWDVFGGKS